MTALPGLAACWLLTELCMKLLSWAAWALNPKAVGATMRTSFVDCRGPPLAADLAELYAACCAARTSGTCATRKPSRFSSLCPTHKPETGKPHSARRSRGPPHEECANLFICTVTASSK